jgi:indolepyruvate ferredoxin oxidoreductase
VLFGAAWQKGLVPLRHDAITQAVTLHGTAVERNLRAFEIGRWAMLHPDEAAGLLSPKVVRKDLTLDQKIAHREDLLIAYQGKRLAKKYRKLVDQFQDPSLKEAVAKGYAKLLAYKDEYEVARLLLSTEEKARTEFDGEFTLKFHMAPPILSKMGANGRPEKREFGPGMLRWLRLLARMKRLRGTPLDLFGRTEERKMERALIKQYERDMALVRKSLTSEKMETAIALAELPLTIRGFGPVKMENEAKAAKQREALLAQLRSDAPTQLKAAE